MSNYILYDHLKKIKRAFLIWLTLISLLVNLWLDSIRFKVFQTKSNEKNKVQIKRAKWFTNQLIKLGSAFIKIGQLLSARPDLIPNTWIQELSKLQDQVPNFSFEQVEKIEEATNIAQDAPEILKKEFDSLKESIIQEASRMEKAENIQGNKPRSTYQNSEIKKALNEIEAINKQIDLLNKTMNNQTK